MTSHENKELASSVLKFCSRKDLSNDIQIRVISSVEPEISTKMLRKLNEKLNKIACDYKCYSMVKFARLDDTFSEFFELEASAVEG